MYFSSEVGVVIEREDVGDFRDWVRRIESAVSLLMLEGELLGFAGDEADTADFEERFDAYKIMHEQAVRVLGSAAADMGDRLGYMEEYITAFCGEWEEEEDEDDDRESESGAASVSGGVEREEQGEGASLSGGMASEEQRERESASD